MSTSDIAEQCDISERQVQRIYREYRETRWVARRPGQGRKKVLNRSLKVKVLNMVRSKPSIDCAQIAERLPIRVTSETIRQYLKSVGYTYKKASRIPNLSREDEARRVEFAQNSMEIEPDSIIFTDECTFDLNGSTKVWGKKGKRVPQISYTYAPRVQVWGAIGTEGKMYLKTYTGTMNAKHYKKMLQERFLPLMSDFTDDPWILQQDGATAHTAGEVTSMLEDNGVGLLDWPARSPDLNPIENVWGNLKKAVYKRRPKDVMELEDMIFEEWDELDDEVIGNYAGSFTSRLDQVIRAGGKKIKY